MPNANRRCTGCKGYFARDSFIKTGAGYFHSYECAASYGLKKSKDDAHKKLKKKVRSNDKSHWTKKAQSTFNKYIRLRDSKHPCISCGRFHTGQYHAGHYRTVGANPELRFDERNCHKQCSACNNHLSGNIVNYRINLIRKIGEEEVNRLESYHEPKRYKVDDFKIIHKWYARKIKRIKT